MSRESDWGRRKEQETGAEAAVSEAPHLILQKLTSSHYQLNPLPAQCTPLLHIHQWRRSLPNIPSLLSWQY